MFRSLLFMFLFLGMAQAEPQAPRANDFWKLESERAGAVTVTTFVAAKSPAKGQGVLMCAHWPAPQGVEQAPLQPTEIVASLYGGLKDFQLLGSKETDWAGQPARLIAFKAMVNKRHVVGRCLLAQVPAGTEALLLVTNHDMQTEFRKEFDPLQGRWEFGGPAASNVLYSH